MSGSSTIRDDPPTGNAADCWYVFRTTTDERVCPECGPLDNTLINGSWSWLHPPLHTNCRCWLQLAWCDTPTTTPSDDTAFLPPELPGPGVGGPF
jgi:hypothetical protein